MGYWSFLLIFSDTYFPSKLEKITYSNKNYNEIFRTINPGMLDSTSKEETEDLKLNLFVSCESETLTSECNC